LVTKPIIYAMLPRPRKCGGGNDRGLRMSEYTREEILKLIEENGGPEGLDLSGKDLSGIDLTRQAIQAELEKVRESTPDRTPVWFSEETNGINLQGANLSRANLQEAYLLLGANLQEADLLGANLQGASLWSANLQEARLLGANLRRAGLGQANLQEADLAVANLQEADLWGANLQEANLLGANLQGAKLGRANLQGANLRVANLQEANLAGANLQEADLAGANLQEADLRGTKLEGAFFSGVRLDHTEIARGFLGSAIGEELARDYPGAKDAYLRLKQDFDDLGDYAASSWAYRKERQMEKMCSTPWRARRYYGQGQLGDVWTWDEEEQVLRWESGPPTWHPRVLWFYTRHTLKWLSDWFVELLCGYGESIWRVLAWMLLVILGFAAYYQVSHAVVISSQDAVTSLWDHLIFSLGAFTTLQPARLQAARPGVELLTTIQAIIGISLAGLLGFVAGNRIRRS
jgi:uncharacterized protein YjbI with pentapeptide repeats